jgi:hypothetical protein
MTPKEFIPNPTFVGLLAQEWIPLSTAADLAAIDDNLTGTSYTFAANTPYQVVISNTSSVNMLDKNYFLINNIDLSSFANWAPLGTFTGELDGVGYNISNLTLSSADTNTQGLFTIINNGSIKNLSIFDARVTININSVNTFSNFGILTGIIQGTSSIENLKILRSNTNSSFLKASFGAGINGNRPLKFGPIAGFLSGTATISNTIVDTQVYAYDKTGGFIGDIRQLNSLTISDSSFVGQIIGGAFNAAQVVDLGGLVGGIFSAGTISIIRSNVKADIALGGYAGKEFITSGGFIGVLREQLGPVTATVNPGPAPDLIIRESYFIGNMSGHGNQGKFIGSIYISNSKITGSVLIEDSYAIGNITGTDRPSGQLIGSARLGGRTLTLNRVYVIGDVIRSVASKSNLGILIGTNGDNDGAGSGTITPTNVFYSSFTTYEKIDSDTNPRIIGTNSNSSTLTGVTAQTESNLRNANTYSGWNSFSTAWRINLNKNNGYPYLAWQD